MTRPVNIQIVPMAGSARTPVGPSEIESDQTSTFIAKTGSPLKGLARMAAGYIFGRDRGPQTTEKRADEEETADGNNTVEEPEHEEEEAVPTIQLGLNASCKRPLPRDIYQIPGSPHGSDQEEEIRMDGPRKRPRTSVKAKKSIVAPRRSSGNSKGVPNTQSRAEPDRRAKPSLTAGSAPANSSPLKSSNIVTSQPAKRPRGRPRKDALTPVNPVTPVRVSHRGHPQKNTLSPHLPIAGTTVSSRGHRLNPSPILPGLVAVKKVSQRAIRQNPVSAPGEVPDENTNERDDEFVPEQEERQEEEEDQEEGHGISSILMNPSPIKVARPCNGQGSKGPNEEVGRSKGMEKESQAGDDASQVSEPEVSEDDEEDQEADPEAEPQENYGGFLINIRVLDEMISTADRVGYYYNKESETWSKKLAPIVCSQNGKRMMRRLEGIQKAYQSLRNAISARDAQASKKAKNSIVGLVEALQKESRSILTKRLGNPLHGIEFLDADKTKVMLQDVYFHIIPEILKILKVATEVYPPKWSKKQSALQNLSIFTTILEDLATTALLQPKQSQPRAESKSDTYHVSKPTSLIIPEIRKIRKSLSRELEKTKLVQKATKFEASQSDWNRQAEEQERRRDEEIRRIRKENRRKQREVYEALCSRTLYGRLHRDKDDARNGIALSRDRYSAGYSGANGGSKSIDHGQDIQDDDDPFAEEGSIVDGPRLSLFPKNNTNDSTHSRPLSEKEKETFVECMRMEHGNDRYQKAAEQLGRSIEEIFTFAKDLQEAMDRKRENGQFMERHDGWTYDIWVEKQAD